ncbi:MAG: calcium/sodium antiporter [Candidatus Diapherotrites archaeon]|nr:calcium/sodium antiporter [Candidatus Diapherotrites archaeon]
MDILIDVMIFIISSFVIIKTADELVEASSRIAKSFGLNEFIIGLTIVAVGTSLPEMAASVTAVILGLPGIAVGNVIGSNITNILLVIGAVTFLMPLSTNWEQKRRDSILMLAITLIASIFLFTGNLLDRIEGIILMIFFPLSVYFILKQNHLYDDIQKKIVLMDWIIVIISLIFLIASSSLFVGSAKNIATYFSLSETVIGMTLVALSTSLPELVSAMMAALKKKAALAVGDIVGSNLFNISMVLGLSAAINPITIESSIYFMEIPLMILSAIILVYFIKKGKIPKWIGAVFIIGYLLFIAKSIGLI